MIFMCVVVVLCLHWFLGSASIPQKTGRPKYEQYTIYIPLRRSFANTMIRSRNSYVQRAVLCRCLFFSVRLLCGTKIARCQLARRRTLHYLQTSNAAFRYITGGEMEEDEDEQVSCWKAFVCALSLAVGCTLRVQLVAIWFSQTNTELSHSSIPNTSALSHIFVKEIVKEIVTTCPV